MVKAEWGQKRMCQSCGARFYDMRRDPIVCPKCETVFDPGALAKPRRQREAAAPPRPPAAEKAPVDETATEPAIEEDIEEISDESEEEDETIEDASELGEDDDDMAEVMENLDEDEER